MKNFKFLVTVLMAAAMTIFISSCSTEDELLQSANDFTVDFKQAQDFAKIYFQNQQKDKLSLRSDWLGESTTFNGANNLPGIHVFNYENGEDKSFVIVSGDNRIAPILAHGDNDFPLDTLPFGIAEWMNKQILFINSLRTTNLVQTKEIGDTWQARVLPKENESGCCEECPNYPECLDNPLIGCGANSDILCDGVTDENPCGNNTYFQYGPLLDTKWGQSCVYNELCPEEPIIPYWPWNGPICGGIYHVVIITLVV